MFIFLLVSALIGAANAIEFLPCQRLLMGDRFSAPDGSTIVLAPNQVVSRGNLEAFWETGMEDQTGWSILDAQTLSHLSSNAYDALQILGDGDFVYVLEPGTDNLLARGFHRQIFVPGVVRIDGREIKVVPNLPQLFNNPEYAERAMPEDDYREHFERERPAVAILNLSQQRIAELDRKLSPKLDQYEEHRVDPSRFVAVGSGRLQERQMFETVFAGRTELREDNRLRLVTSVGTMRLIPGDNLYLISASGEDLGRLTINNFPARIQGYERERLSRATKAVLFRKHEDRNFAATDF